MLVHSEMSPTVLLGCPIRSDFPPISHLLIEGMLTENGLLIFCRELRLSNCFFMRMPNYKGCGTLLACQAGVGIKLMLQDRVYILSVLSQNLSTF